MKVRTFLLTLNLFARRNSETGVVRKQILSTRLYIGCLVIFTLILVLATGVDVRMRTTNIAMPTISQFENLFEAGKLPRSCPCSQLAIPYSEFLSLIPTFHQICSSKLISDDWLDRLGYSGTTRPIYYYLDVRSYGLDMFRTLQTFCSLANSTVTDAMTNFLANDWVSNQVWPRQQFQEQIQAFIIDFQSTMKNTFKQELNMAHEANQGNQLLSSRVSNFFFDGTFNNDSHLISVRTYMGTILSTTDMLPTCSCLLNTCSQPLGFFNTSNNGQTVALIVEIPGMYSACYALDGFRLSTLECWFNETCIEIVISHLTPYPVEPQIDLLNSSMLIQFSPITTIGDIVDVLMIEEWTNMINYEMYYKTCKPLTCTYTSYHRFDWVYIITVLAAVFGGLCVALRVICPFLINLYFSCRRNRAETAEGK